VKYHLLLALSFIPTGFAVTPTNSQPLVLTQTTGCPRAEVLTSYETRNFNVYICEGLDNYIFYRGVRKSDGSGINLTASQDAKGTWRARNGNILYKVNLTELVVTDNGKVILKERVISQL
jgi:hypothetical protein